MQHDDYNYLLACSFYSEPLFCSLGIAPFVTAIVIGLLSLCGTLFTTIFVDKVCTVLTPAYYLSLYTCSLAESRCWWEVV